MVADPGPLTPRRLDSWKEIAAFLARSERTVKRWEVERGLPVHRVPGTGRRAVFAYSEELADWLKNSGREAQGPKSESRSLVSMVAFTTNYLRSIRTGTWLLSLLLVASLTTFVGRGGLHFVASANRQIPNAEAQDLYLTGRYFWNRRTPDDLNKAVDYFTRAIVKDPNYAQAYVGMADCYNLLREFGTMSPSEAYPRALSAAQRAVALDDMSADAHASLAFATYWWLWKGETAEREFRRALDLNPNSVRAHHWYATYLLGRNRFPEALDQIEQARKLDPSSTAILADKAVLLWQSGYQTAGLHLLNQLETTEPLFSSTHDYLGRIYWTRNDYVKALAEWRLLAELRHDEAGLAVVDAGEKGFAAHGLTGLLERELPVQKELVDRGTGSAYALATTYAALGMQKDALAYLEMSFDRHEQAMLIGDPIPSLANDPKYQKFRDRVSERLAQ